MSDLPTPHRRRVLTENGKDAAVAMVRKCGRNVRWMAAAAGVSYGTMSNHLAEDEEFAARVDEAEMRLGSRLFESTWKRAVDGFEGVNGEKKYSDILSVRFLQALDRERFGNQVKVDQHTTVTARVDVSKLSDEAAATIEAALAKEVEGAPQVAHAAGALGPPPVEAEFEVLDADGGGLDYDPADGYEPEDFPTDPEE